MIPVSLRAERRWIVARLETVNGRLTKVPYRADDPSRKASTTDPATWADFETALRAMREHGLLLGFVLGGGFVGVDLDHCVNDGVIEPWAAEIIDLLDSYTEFSVSGTGIHVICRGTLPTGGRRKGQIEVYDAARYFVMTGDVVRVATIEDRTAALAALHARIFGYGPSPDSLAALGVDPNDQRGKENIEPSDLPRPVTCSDDELIALAQHAANGAKFSRLWNGDTSLHGGDDSVADLALCTMLAFWTQCDDERIDRLFRRSKLYRRKWERRDYRKRTISRAVAATGETYQPPVELPDLPLEAETPADMDLTTADVEFI